MIKKYLNTFILFLSISLFIPNTGFAVMDLAPGVPSIPNYFDRNYDCIDCTGSGTAIASVGALMAGAIITGATVLITVIHQTQNKPPHPKNIKTK